MSLDLYTPVESPDMADIGRREFVIGTASLLALTAMGCGSESAREDAASTRQFRDVSGAMVEVPDRATRIVATNDQNAGAQLLSLGAPVVGIASRDGQLDPSISRYFDVDDLTLVGEHFDPNIEAIAGLRPDLIVHEGFDGATTLQPATLTALQSIAPVVSIDVFRPIDVVMAEFADLLGGGAIGLVDQQRAELRDVVAELQLLLGDRWADVTASLVISNSGLLEAWGPTTLGVGNLLSEVGVTWVPLMVDADLPENGGYIAEISEERIVEFSADLIIVDTSYGGDAILDHALFKGLPAVAAGQVVLLDSSEFTDTHYPGVIATARYVIEQVAAMDVRTDLV